MYAGVSKIEITPQSSVWMDGMIRAGRSTGVHDPLFARALVLSNAPDPRSAFALLSVDVCALPEGMTSAARLGVAGRTGLSAEQIIIAATHTHAGPATLGIFNPADTNYVASLQETLIVLVEDALRRLEPTEVYVSAGREETISHYRRLLSSTGRVVMNWEPQQPEQIIGPLGEADPEIGVIHVVARDTRQELAVVFNFASHPNVLSGENTLLSADFPGHACQLLETERGGVALYFNGANGSVDIDGLRDRDWHGVRRAGGALAVSVRAALERSGAPARRVAGRRSIYAIPGRRITESEWRWAEQVLAGTGGAVQPAADGAGDDYKASLLRRLRDAGPRDLLVEQVAISLGDFALLSFPGELYTEIGREIKTASPFPLTSIIGLANGYVGYIPTSRAIAEGGYAEDTRLVDAAAERIIVEQSLALLHTLRQELEEERQ